MHQQQFNISHLLAHIQINIQDMWEISWSVFLFLLLKWMVCKWHLKRVEFICLYTVKWFQVLYWSVIPSRLRLATMQSVSLSMLYMLYDLCRDVDDPWAWDCLSIPIGDLALDGEGTASNLAGSSLNVSSGLSLITSVFIFTLPAWPMGAYAFCLSSLGFLTVGVESISILSLFLVSIRGFGRCPWCNGYRRWKWTRWHEFKSRTRLIAFHIALIPLGKVWIQLFSLQLWVNSRADRVHQPLWGN